MKSVEKGKVCNKDLDKQQSDEIEVDKLDHDILWEQLFSSNLMRLWRMVHVNCCMTLRKMTKRL